MEATARFQKEKIRDLTLYDGSNSFERVIEVEDQSKIQLHPCFGSETIALLTDVIPQQIREIKALVCTENNDASDIEYAMAVIQTDDDEIARNAISEQKYAVAHSGWHRVEKNQIYELTIELPQLLEDVRYLVLATRIPDDGYQRNAWARWLDFEFEGNSKPSYYSTVKLVNVKSSLQSISGEIIGSSTSSPPFGLTAKIEVLEKGIQTQVPISFKSVRENHGYSPQMYIFTIDIPEDFQQQSNDILVSIYSSDEQKIIYKSLLDITSLKKPFGIIDGVSDYRIWGWAWNPQHPQKEMLIDVIFDRESEKPPTQVVANRYRQDLYEAGFGDGCYGFEIYFRNPLDKLAIEKLSMEGGYEIQNLESLQEDSLSSSLELSPTKLNASNRITLR